jgi:Short C-terminal domain/PEGA domain
VCLLAAVFAGCTQTTMFRSDPPGARVSIDGVFTGITPSRYDMPEHPLPTVLRYRIERGGYLPQEGEIRPAFGAGRFFGALFTVGFVYVFRNPYIYQQSYDFALSPLDDPRDVQKDPLRIDERLRRLKDLFDQGLISEEEYQRQRAAILHEL